MEDKLKVAIKKGVIAVVTLSDVNDADQLAEALIKCGHKLAGFIALLND